MRGVILLLSSLCLVSARKVHHFEEHVEDHFDVSDVTEWLDFDLTYSERLTPIVSLLCAPLDYFELSVVPGWPEQGVVNKLQKSLCSKLPRDQRIDFSYIKDCLNNTECFNTNKMEFLVGLTNENIFFSHYNIETVPKAPIVSACLKEDPCPAKNEAEELLSEWKTLLENCDKVEDKQELKEAMEGVSMVALVSADDSLARWYQQSLSDCLILTPSVDVKRMMAEKLEPTAACSEEVRDKLVEYVETDWNAPMDVAMTITRQLMSCENETLAHMVENMLVNYDNEYQTGYALWETMKMMADERYQLRKRRDIETSYEKTLQGIVSNINLQQKWDSAPFTWKQSYVLEETAWSSKTIYTVFVTFDVSAENPLATIRLSEVSSYPPMEHHIVVALESELMTELKKFINGEHVDMTQVYRYMTEQGFFIPFKMSFTMLSDEFNYNSEQFTKFVETFYTQLAVLLQSMEYLPGLARMSIEKIGNTEAGVKVFYETQDDGVYMTVVVRQPDGSNFMDLTLKAKVKETESGDVGFSVTGKANMFSGKRSRWDLKAVYEPLTQNLKGSTECEMSIEIYDETTQESVLSMSSCMRPVYISDPSEPLTPLANIYRTLEIPNLLHLNLTLDFGVNGFLGFVSSPKTFLFNMHYLDSLVAEITAKLQLEQNKMSSRKSRGQKLPMFKTLSSAEVKIPSVSDRTASFEMTSKMFEDFSAASIFHINTFLDIDGIAKTYDGVVDASSCAPGLEDMMTNLMFTGELEELPEEICYNVQLKLPDNMGTFDQQFKYEVESADFFYTYKLDLDHAPSNTNVDLSGEVFIQSYYGDTQFTCSVTSPVKANVKFSNFLAGELPDMTQNDVSNVQVTGEGFFFNLQPIDGFSDLSTGGSFSTLDHTPVLESNPPESYAFCTFGEDASPFLGEFKCDLKSEFGSKKMSISSDGEQFEILSDCENGNVEFKMDMEKIWGSVWNTDSIEISTFVVDFVQPEVVIKFKPDPEGPMCAVVEYEGGEFAEDAINRKCLNETLAATQWEEYLGYDLSAFLNSIDFEYASEWSVDTMEQFLANIYDEYVYHWGFY